MIIHHEERHASAGRLARHAAALALILASGCAGLDERKAAVQAFEAAASSVPAELYGAEWIAAGDGDAQGAAGAAAEAGFVHAFEAPPGWGVESARLAVAARGGYVVYVNGARAGEGIGEEVRVFNVRRELHWGRNVIAIAVAPAAGESRPPAVIARLNIEYDEGIPATIVTGPDWKAKAPPVEGWISSERDFSGWPAARPISDNPAGSQNK